MNDLAKKNDTILIVDDTPENLQFLGVLLKRINYIIIEAKNGIQALELADKVNPDLILLDIMMPEMNGFEVCDSLKQNPKTKDIPVIFLTGKTEPKSVVKAFETGAVDYVTKPFTPTELLARVKTHLELRRSKKELEEALKAIKVLQGIIPICSSCKKIRDDSGYWNQLEAFIEKHSDALFSHGICPQCSEKLYGEQEWYKKMKDDVSPPSDRKT